MLEQALFLVVAVALVGVVTLAVFLSRNHSRVGRDNTVGPAGGGYAGAAYSGHSNSNDCGPGHSGSCDAGGGGDGGGGGD
jgi:hypothetical protein